MAIDRDEYIEFRTEVRAFLREGREMFEEFRRSLQKSAADDVKVEQLEIQVEKNTSKLALHDKIVYGGIGILFALEFVMKFWPFINGR